MMKGSLVDNVPNRVLVWIGIAAVVLVVLIFVVGQIVLRDNNITEVNLERGNTLALRAQIDLPVSELTLQGGAAELVTGELRYQLPAYAPLFSYDVVSREGALFITQNPQAQTQNIDLADYRSTLAFNSEVPLALQFTQAQGEASLQLSDLTLTALNATFGTGHTTVRQDGAQPIMTDLTLLSDEGADTVNFTCGCPSLIRSHIALGQDADTVQIDGAYPALAELQLALGVGDDEVELRGDYPTITSAQVALGGGDDSLTLSGAFNPASNLIINIGTGNDAVSLMGDWSNNTTVTLISEGDTANVTLPADVGVYVEIANRTNTVNADGFTREGAAYVNSAYGESPVTLIVNINATANENITLTLADGDAGSTVEITPEATQGG